MSDKTSYPSPATIIRFFAPGWFASVMGTGMFAILCLALSAQWPWLKGIALALHFFNIILALVLFIPWVLRWFLYPLMAWSTLKHPIQANFYPTFSIALLVLAAEFLAFDCGVPFAIAIWWGGTLLTYFFSFAILYHIFMNETVAPEHITAAQFMPAVGLVVIPIAGGPLLAHMSGTMQEIALLFNIFGLGAGSLLYLGLFALMVYRGYLHKPALGILTPTVWIQMSPIGIIPVSLMNLLPHLHIGGTGDFSKVLALLFCGAGLWWLVMCALITFCAYRHKQLPFALTWWAFIFPLGSLANLCLRTASVMQYQTIYAIGIFVTVLMALLWVVTLYKTFLAVLKGGIFEAPKQ